MEAGWAHLRGYSWIWALVEACGDWAVRLWPSQEATYRNLLGLFVQCILHPMAIVSSNLIKTLPCIGARSSLNASIGCTKVLGCGCGATDATRSMRMHLPASGGRRMGVGADLGCIERGADQCECPFPVGHFKELPTPLALVRCSDTAGRVGEIRLGGEGLDLRQQMTMKIVRCAIWMC